MKGHNLKVETFHWIIQIGFYSFLLKQKSDKILQFFSNNAHPFWNRYLVCLGELLIHVKHAWFLCFYARGFGGSRLQLLKRVLKKCEKHRKTHVLEPLVNKIADLQSATLLKRDSISGAFLWILIQDIQRSKNRDLVSRLARKQEFDQRNCIF